MENNNGGKKRVVAVRWRLKELYNELGITPKQASEKIDIIPSTLSILANNQRTVINKEHLVEVANGLGISDITRIIEFVYEGEDN